MDDTDACLPHKEGLKMASENRDYSIRCISCKWRVIGHYNKYYGGCPIGCNSPNKEGGGFQKGCGYEPKEGGGK